MSNLQSIIAKTKFELKKQETQMNEELNELKKYVDIILKTQKCKQEINEFDFSFKVKTELEKMQKVLASLNIELKNEKISRDFSGKIIEAVYPISSMIASIKNTSSSLISAQNVCAMKGDKQGADKIAKLSLELNYENHMFVKKASEEIKILKQNLDIKN